MTESYADELSAIIVGCKTLLDTRKNPDEPSNTMFGDEDVCTVGGDGAVVPTNRRSRGEIPPPHQLLHTMHAGVEIDPAQPTPSTSATATELAPRHGETGWKKVRKV